jgi:selenocysteine-specific elongation factor
MSTRNYILATAGHVDHGKSALVKTLTGIDPDRLPEEKARGITIELGFAHVELPADLPGVSLHIGIVDVPGHEDFIKNMVAGVGSVDLALLTVAADDGWMPQTEEHLQILQHLGVERAVVAVTKIDLTGSSEESVVASAREALRGTIFAGAPIVPTSSVTGRGIDELKAALSRAFSEAPPPRDIGKPRLPIDRVFSLRGVGTVITGTLAGGRLNRNQPVVLEPSGKAARIRSIQTHNREVESVGPGMRTALNLADVNDSEVRRGDVVTAPESAGAHLAFDVLLERSTRLYGNHTRPARPLKDGALVRVHHGSANVPARVVFLEKAEMNPGQKRVAQLRLKAPLLMFIGDRFIIRDCAEQMTLGGGLVLDMTPARVFSRSPAHRELLEKRAASPQDPAIAVQTLLDRDGIVCRTGLLGRSKFSEIEIVGAIEQLRDAGTAVISGNLVASAPWWKKVLQAAVDAIDERHRSHPEQAGLPLSELRDALDGCLFLPETFPAMLAGLSKAGFIQSGNIIRRLNHRLALPPQLEEAGRRIRSALSIKLLDPPSRKELAPDKPGQQVLRFLIDNREAVEVSAEIVLLSEGFARAAEMIRKLLQDRGAATVSELRQYLNSSRRIVVPLLEKLDRDGITRREGDKRFLR